jgi:Starch-binding associating with outer membrane
MKKYILLLFIAIVFLGSSCKDFLNVNETNPNNASQVAARLVLPASINRVATTLNNPRRFDFVYLWHGLWSISAGYSQPQNLVQYKLLNSNYQLGFREFYTAANNLDVIEKSSTDPKDVYFVAIAKIMKAYIFQNLVDCWGDVPYAEAFQTGTGNLKPKYEAQQTIYEALVTDLDAAMDLIQNASSDANAVLPAADIMYGGDMTEWQRFANTVKLRMLIHQADMAGRTSYITGEIAKSAAYGYLGAGESALVNPGYVISAGKMNPFYETFYNPAGTSQSDGITYYFAGKDAVDYLVSTNDPRIGKYFLPYSGTNYAGNFLGNDPSLVSTQALTSKLGYISGDAGTMIGTPTKSSPLLTDFESLFIQAEAAQRGLITATAKDLYNSAVTQSFKYTGLTSTAAAAFLSQASPKMNFDNAPNKLEIILTQKWVALDGVAPVEIWTDYRRTGFPLGLHFSPDAARANDTPPIRLLYPQDEINVNNDNVLAAYAQQNYVDEFKTKLFWQNR